MSLHEPMSNYWIYPDVKDNTCHELLTPEISLSHQTGFTNWRYETDDVLMFKWSGANGDKVIRDTVALLHTNEAYIAFLSMQAG